MNRNRLNIGTYFLHPYARSEKHIREMKECGIDFVVCFDNDRAALDLFAKYDIGAVLSGIVPGWWGGDGDNAGTMEAERPLNIYTEAAAKFEDHPAVWGIDIGDEPSAKDFEHYGKVFDTVNRAFPMQFPYVNLYPNYASVSQNTADETVNQLGTPTYDEHIARYCEKFPADYICYDFYLYSINVTKAYENLRVVSDACLRSGRSMWIVLQVNSNRAEEWITENGLRFQAYTAMAFGAENIIWACYTAGWWYNQVLDANGEKTAQYDKLKKVNGEIHTIAAEYANYRRTATHFVGFDGTDWLEAVNQKSVASLDTGVFTDVHAKGNTPLVIGQMVSKNGASHTWASHALMIAAADDPYDRDTKEINILFKADGRRITALGGNGNIPVERTADGYCSVTIKSNDGVLITAK